MTLPDSPKNILLIKAHSMGIGDLLRSSAAWAALKIKWPDVQLHLLMLSNHAGYPSEEFMRSHYLLASAHFVTVKQGNPGQSGQKKLPVSQVCGAVAKSLEGQQIDLVIDFETSGLRTPWIARWIARRKGAYSVGIAQFPLRSLFYDAAAPSSRAYQRVHGLTRQMDYTERDFVALAALGITRNGTRIALKPGAQALEWQAAHPLKNVTGHKVVVLNIGCGTLDALPKRPDLSRLADCMLALLKVQAFQLHLSGAPFEKDVNSAFSALFHTGLQTAGLHCELTDWAGELSIGQLSGLLARADLVVSTDSGPYHMAVGLGVPTVCWFNFDTPPSYHRQAGVQVVINPDARAFVAAAVKALELA